MKSQMASSSLLCIVDHVLEPTNMELREILIIIQYVHIVPVYRSKNIITTIIKNISMYIFTLADLWQKLVNIYILWHFVSYSYFIYKPKNFFKKTTDECPTTDNDFVENGSCFEVYLAFLKQQIPHARRTRSIETIARNMQACVKENFSPTKGTSLVKRVRKKYASICQREHHSH